jgi:hypothetical protein
MSQKPKTNAKPVEKIPDPAKTDSWEEDQKKRGYYYDDACGYEAYEPDHDDRDEDRKDSRGTNR